MRKLFALLLITALLLAGCGGSGSQDDDSGASGEQAGGLAADALLAEDPNATAIVTTLAGSGEQGSQDGAGAGATFTQPVDVTVGPDGNIYTISFRGRRITRITPEGEVTTLAVSENTGDSDGPVDEARFGNSRSLVVTQDGTIYFADWENKKLRKLTSDGQIMTVAESGFLETMVLDADGNILSPAGSSREFVMRITPAGEMSTAVGLAANAGSVDGDSQTAKFSNLSGIALDEAGNMYVSQGISLRQKLGDQLVRKISPDGAVETIAGQRFQEGYVDGPGIDAQFNFPSALVAAPSGTLFVADSVNNCIRRIGPAPTYEVTTVAGVCGENGDLVDGDGLTARFKNPQGIAIDAEGNLYVADALNNAIRKITFQ